MATNSSQSSVNVGNIGESSSAAEQVVKIIPTKRNRDVWQHYDLCEMTSGAKKARCKHCGKFYGEDANSTLKNHVEKKYCKALKNLPDSEFYAKLKNHVEKPSFMLRMQTRRLTKFEGELEYEVELNEDD